MYHVKKAMQKVRKEKYRGECDTMAQAREKGQTRRKGKETKSPHFSNFSGTRPKGK
jgi:hypothetical protein